MKLSLISARKQIGTLNSQHETIDRFEIRHCEEAVHKSCTDMRDNILRNIDEIIKNTEE